MQMIATINNTMSMNRCYETKQMKDTFNTMFVSCHYDIKLMIIPLTLCLWIVIDTQHIIGSFHIMPVKSPLWNKADNWYLYSMSINCHYVLERVAHRYMTQRLTSFDSGIIQRMQQSCIIETQLVCFAWLRDPHNAKKQSTHVLSYDAIVKPLMTPVS